MVEKTDYCGLVSGGKSDKSGLFGVFYGEVKKAPLIVPDDDESETTGEEPKVSDQPQSLNDAAENAAIMYSLLGSCKACDVNPWEYFNDMLRRIMGHPINHLRELLPDQWQPALKDDHGLLIP